MILDTPKLKMRGGYDCGACALAVVFAYHGLTLPEEYYRLSSPALGIGPHACLAVLGSSFGGFCEGIGWTLADLQSHLSQNRPSMALVSVEEACDHWVVVRGIENGRVYYHDPAYGRRSKSEKAWLKWWKGPDANDYPNFGLVAWSPSGFVNEG